MLSFRLNPLAGGGTEKSQTHDLFYVI